MLLVLQPFFFFSFFPFNGFITMEISPHVESRVLLAKLQIFVFSFFLFFLNRVRSFFIVRDEILGIGDDLSSEGV